MRLVVASEEEEKQNLRQLHCHLYTTWMLAVTIYNEPVSWAILVAFLSRQVR